MTARNSDARRRKAASVVVAVPVKDLVNAKQRLVPALEPAQRQALAAAMLEDVLDALRGAAIDAVWVVTRDAAVGAIAQRFGAAVLPEHENRGHTAAAAAAQARARDEGCEVFVTVPGDVPAVTATEVDALVAAIDTRPGVALAPSRSGLGTNGVALSPPDGLPLRFGEPSFDNHLAAARARGLSPRVLRLPGLGLDVDDADDLRVLLSQAPGTRSAGLVASWNLAARPVARPAGRGH